MTAGGYGAGGSSSTGGGFAMSQTEDQRVPLQSSRMQASRGVAFQTDLGQVGRAANSTGRIFSGAGANIMEDERRMIDKVFTIVDKDGSGTIDMNELKHMFEILGIESNLLTTALTRIMANVEQDYDGNISTAEFYKILSTKFNPGDPKKDIETVFHKMDDDKDGKLNVEDIYKVSQILGDNVEKSEIRDMIKFFSLKYQKQLADYNASRGKTKADMPKDATELDFDDFYACMQRELNEEPMRIPA
eukprot:TRINITY_DN65195_c0_g1_i1.p1 TRINITY_DN65195_c0_g1~~TRINITY_DN65195_c0_g1_i1.p1  ORF type:complete len:283 (-),score=83.11 TRINITY_DN65195_c0_g1_i1:125-862(-)